MDKRDDLQNNNSENLIRLLSDMLLSYTKQLEDYERANGTLTLTAVTVLIGIITLILTIHEPFVYFIGVFLIPCFEIVFCFAFAHYNRRIAYYRGYCINLENKLNRLVDETSLLFHDLVCYDAMKPFGIFLGAVYIIFIICFLVSFIAFGIVTFVFYSGIYRWLLLSLGYLLLIFMGITLCRYIHILTINGEVVKYTSDDNEIIKRRWFNR